MIAIVKYNAGNTFSVQKALDRLHADYVLTDDKSVLEKADKIIFPGVGHALSAFNSLKEKGLDALLTQLKQPVLGICVGMQLMCSYSEEGDTPCLGIFKEKVLRFPSTGKVPHMGWNSFEQMDEKSALLQGIQKEDNVYFVHSYCAEVGENTIATSHYILPFSAAMQKDNFYGVQFHPEKSSSVGEKIIKNFISL